MNLDLQGKNVFITGGTGSVGTALVDAFVKTGASVWFQYNENRDRAMNLTQEFQCKSIQIDFSQLSAEKLPSIDFDIVVNNAAINMTKSKAAEISDYEWAKTIDVNLNAPFVVARKYIPFMVSRNWGRIINISSIYGVRGTTNNLPYTVSKHGLSGLTKTICKDYAEFGITCNEICPGPIESELMQHIAETIESQRGIPKETYLADIRASIPAKRMAFCTEIASLAVFLASELAGYINGASVVLDGGLLA